MRHGAIARGDLDRAVALAITNIRLGAMLQRGGTVVEDLIGVAVHGIANHRLAELRSGLSPDQARQIITAWEQALNDREPLESIIYRDRAMAERAYGWAARLGNILEGIPIRSNIYEPMQQACFRHETTARLLQTELALQLYRVEHGQMAESLDQLVPGYLPAVPLDAWSQQPLIYRLTESGFVLYSVGYDGQDNGGRVTNLKTYYTRDRWGRIGVGYDFDLDTTIRP